uniref:UBC core domain-containing protein n=2 Tax=Clastoptera arizonana TaxID=38151 RepID=A0A1B6CR24_9HEMI
MAAELQYFYEDEVFRFNKKGNIEFGMVIENSELVSSGDDSDVEEGCKIMKKGHIRVSWHPTGAEDIIPEKKVGLADRSLMPGDVVRRMIKGKDTQRGYCRDIKVTASVQVLNSKYVIPNVKCESLVPLEDFTTDIAVCLDSWVGDIKAVKSKLLLQCFDGSRCYIRDPETCGFEVFEDKHDEKEYDFPRRSGYFPGQTLMGPICGLEEADWLFCTKKMKMQRSKTNSQTRSNKNIKVIIESVETESVCVHWQCRAYSKEGAGSEKEQPPYPLIEGEDLKRLRLLNVFEPCTLQVGDKNFYTIQVDETFITKERWRRNQKDLVLSNGSAGHIPPITYVFNLAKTRSKLNKLIGDYSSLSVKDLDETMESLISNDHVNSNTRLSDSHSGKSSSTDSSGVQINSTNSLDIEPDKRNGDRTSPSNSIKGDADWDTDSGSDDDYGTDTDSITSSNASSTTSSTGSFATQKRKGPIALMTKVLKKKNKLHRARKKQPRPLLEPGTKLVVETLSTASSAVVIWQDGSVETDIPSTQLYPIHHLDDQEFFPGDFVIENREDGCMRVYGVVQSVDHAGRTATVKWFRTYTSSDNPQPSFLQQNEVSVYDLKDHPDFQYRPGTVVVRVANFEGEDANCTAGQVLDNYPEGRVRVWWVDGHISMCWPQDLYKVGEYDSDEGELWDDGSSEGSWETESEDCYIADEGLPEEVSPESLKPKLAANIEKARVAMSRLEEIFTQNPALQTTDVMRKLLDVYKDCRYLDKLMGTTFFHEDHFQGLLERVREKGRVNVAQRVADQVNRLFNQPEETNMPEHICTQLEGKKEVDLTPSFKVLAKISVPENDSDSRNNFGNSANLDSNGLNTSSCNKESLNSGEFLSENLAGLELQLALATHDNSEEISPQCCEDSTKTIKKQNLEGSDNVCFDMSGSIENNEPVCNSHVCVKLCSLILAQLVKAHAEVMLRFGINSTSGITLSEAANSVSPSNNHQEVIENKSELSEDFKGFEKCDIPILEPSPVPSPSSSTGDKEGGFVILDTAPNCHKYKLTMFQPTDTKRFFKTVRDEIDLLHTSLPSGIWVKAFEDRMDLYSVMIRGPQNTPYEDGLFLFDFQLSADYPKAPPLCHYISYCSDRLNPNLYEDGKVCVSLLGTWSGKGTEVWTLTSNLLQIIVSIQGLILVSEPYFNEAGYEKQKGSQQGRENSRMYNEMVVLKLVQAVTKLIIHPPAIFKQEIMAHFTQHAYRLCSRLEGWLEISEKYNSSHPISPTTPNSFKELQEIEQLITSDVKLPEFPLIPASKGFCLTLHKTLATFRDVLSSVGINPPS